MNIRRNIKRVVSTVTNVVCNACGKSCLKAKKENSLEFATICATWGYFSDNRDGQVHEGHLCQICFDKITKKFAIPTLVYTDTFKR
jgi:hypothetical protein